MKSEVKIMKGRFWFVLRFTTFLLINLVLWPILKPIFKSVKYGFFSFIFLTYPGDKNQAKGYIPLALRGKIPLVTVIGVVARKKGKWGLVLSTPWTFEEIEEKGLWEKLAIISKDCAKDIGARNVAMAGRLPSLLSRSNSNGDFSEIIAAGREGTIYTVSTVLSSLIKTNGFNKDEPIKLGIIGYGFIGLNLVSILKNRDDIKEIVVYDPKIERTRKTKSTLITSDQSNLEGCNVVILLTERGRQIEEIINSLKFGVIVIDETHPQIPNNLVDRIKQNKNGRVIKATVKLEGANFIPRLPLWQSAWIPGCCVGGMVASSDGPYSPVLSSTEEFRKVAEKFNFEATLVSNKLEL
jgi:hypothetical protein